MAKIEQSKKRVLYKSILTLACFGGLRGAEYLATNFAAGPLVNQITFQSTKKGTIMYYKVLCSKTKKHGFKMPYMCSGNPICAICCMEAHLLNRLNTGERIENSPLFKIDGKQVTKQAMNAIIKTLLKSIGANPEMFSLHSIRHGATTTAAQKRFADWELKLVGGWSTNTYWTYINSTNSQHRARFSKRLAQ